MKIIVTGGAGFIGSCFVRMMIGSEQDSIVTLDKLTYAGNLDNLSAIAGNERHQFVRGDICDRELVNRLFERERPEAIVHFAAESHVDRSILAPDAVFETNLRGTFTLLEAARRHGIRRFVHVSTDEVYGSLEDPIEAVEDFPLRPSSPYSAAKAGSDLLALSYVTTYGLPVLVTRASNNYGPYQFPEKMIPLMIANALRDAPLPVYGDGQQVRDWLHVEDHCRAILSVLRRGRDGEIYNIGGNASLTNMEVVRQILAATRKPESLIQHVTDRPGHDRRYALSSAKLTRETGWSARMDFKTGLAQTVQWYQDNPEWLRRVTSGEYRKFYAENYNSREVLVK